VVEGGGADHQIEVVIGAVEVFGDAASEPDPFIAGRGPGDLDHGWGRVDADRLARLWIANRQGPEQVAGSAADVEHPPGGGHE
jgi:hypothetical protein